MSDVAIRVEHLGKQYRLGGQQLRYATFRETLVNAARAPLGWLKGERRAQPTSFWALDDVSFEVKHGEAVGIIGRNGAGKSTLLKILSRITSPTRGRVDIYGRVGSLLEVGTGFHPELTGRENIFLNGAILGMTRREIIQKFDEIVAFAEIEKFLDTAVKFYSSGMYVRLAFAVAAHLEPEILVVDEVLAVGDAEFQKKSLGKMGDVAKEGRTVLFVSHNMAAITTFCRRVILLGSGIVQADDNAEKVIHKYLHAEKISQAERTWQKDSSSPKNEFIKFHRVAVTNIVGEVTQDFLSNQDLNILVDYWNIRSETKLTTTLVLYNQDGQIVFSSISNHERNWHGISRPAGLFRSICKIPSDMLSPGNYEATVLICTEGYQECLREDKLVQFTIHDAGNVRGDYFGGYSGIIRPLLEWNTTRIS
jgi:lipopolysaccharide transport system ATP-binding protein